MTAFLPVRRRAEQFASLVGDRHADGGPAPIDTELLALADALRTVGRAAPEPRPDFAADLRSRLLAEADTALVPTDNRLVLSPTSRHRGNRAGAAVASLIVLASGTGVAVASGGALPGQALYPVKRGLETFQESVSFSETARGRDLLGQARTRLGEARTLVERGGDEERIVETIRAFRTQAGKGTDLVFTAYQRGEDRADIDAAREFAGSQMSVIGDLTEQVPTNALSDLQLAGRLLVDIDQQARVLCAQCGARPPLELPEEIRLMARHGPLPGLLSVDDVSAARVSSALRESVGVAHREAERQRRPNAVTLPDLDAPLDTNDRGTLGAGTPTGTGDSDKPAPSQPTVPLSRKLPVPLTEIPNLPLVPKETTDGLNKATDPLLTGLGLKSDQR